MLFARRFVFGFVCLSLSITSNSHAQDIVFDQPWSINCGQGFGSAYGSDIPGCVHTATRVSLDSAVTGDRVEFWGAPPPGDDPFNHPTEGAIEAFTIEMRSVGAGSGMPGSLLYTASLPVGSITAELDQLSMWRYSADLSIPLTLPGGESVFITVAAQFDHQTNAGWAWAYSCVGDAIAFQFLSCCCGDPAWFDFFPIGFSFRLLQNTPPCTPDLTGDGELNFFDISAFLNAFNAMDPIADFTGDGLFNFFDVSAFLNAFSAGCP